MVIRFRNPAAPIGDTPWTASRAAGFLAWMLEGGQ
jgi:hypothetical protein